MIDRTNKITPEDIQELNENEVFVFGSNESGIHGAGAALTAKKKFGAKAGVGYGPTGKCFAIPTKGWDAKGVLPLLVLQCFVARFSEYAMMHPEKKFLVTKVGCGLAGWTPEEVAPLFACFALDEYSHVSLPDCFWDVIENTCRDEIIKNMLITDDETTNELSDISGTSG